MRCLAVAVLAACATQAHAEEQLADNLFERAPTASARTGTEAMMQLEGAGEFSRPTMLFALPGAGVPVPGIPQGSLLARPSQPVLHQSQLGWGHARGAASSRVSMAAKYPGTDIEINSEGVTFPIVAEVEVGEAGKSCSGEETATGVTGSMTMTQVDAENIVIDYEVKGLAKGLHGFHIHEKADFSNGCASAGPHYNPFGKNHGAPEDEDRHAGDLGNIEGGEDGVAKGQIKDKLVKLFGEYSVVGRSIMIHADPDDLGRGPLEGWPETPAPPAPGQHTKTTGNAGARIACGVVKIKGEDSPLIV